jgi:hypothetical protein
MTRTQRAVLGVLMQTLLWIIAIIDWSLFAQQILHLSLVVSALSSGLVGAIVGRLLDAPCRRWINNG